MRRPIRSILPLVLGFAALTFTGMAKAELLPEQLNTMAWEALDAGNCELAVDYYGQYVAVVSDDKKAWYNLGHCLAKLKRHEEEIEAYRKALAIDPDYRKAMQSLLYAHHDSGQWEGVVQVGTRLESMDPVAFEDWVYMGHAYFKMAQSQPSMKAKNGILALSMDASTKCIARTPEQKMCWYNRGLAREQLGELDAAKADYLAAIELDPEYLKAMYALTYVYELRGEAAKELELWQRYIPLAADKPEFTEHVAYGRTRVQTLEGLVQP